MIKSTIKINGAPVVISTSKWFEPYSQTGRNAKTNLKDNTRAIRGVYFVKNKRSGNIVYVGSSLSQLYKTIYRHFQSWTDSRQKRVTYPKSGYLIKIILTGSSKITLLEQYYIINP